MSEPISDDDLRAFATAEVACIWEALSHVHTFNDLADELLAAREALRAGVVLVLNDPDGVGVTHDGLVWCERARALLPKPAGEA